MQDIKQALRDFVATANSGKYTDEKILLSKFPELEGYDVEALRDFVATSNSGKYTNEDELFSKFPEFNLSGSQTALKKKEPTTTASSLADTSSDLSSEQKFNPFAQNTVGIPQPAKTVAVEETIQPTIGLDTAPTETITETITPVKSKKQELEDILKNVKITEEVPVIKPFDKKTEKILSEGPKSKRTSLASNYSDNLALGLGVMSKIAASIPETAYNLLAIPQNAIALATGLNIAMDANKFKKIQNIQNPLLDAVNREQELTSKKIETFNKENYESSSVYENIIKGNYGDAFELMGAGIIQSAPVSVAMMAGGATLTPLELATAGTAAFFEGNYEELDKENPNMSEIEKTIKALGMAGAETVFASIGTGTIGQVYKDIIKKEGFEAGRVIFKNGLVEAYKTALKKYGAPIGLLGEGLEEAATQITQNMISGKPATQGAADAFIIGAGSGVVFTSPITAAQGIQKVQNLTKDYQAKSTINTILKDKDVELTQVYNVPKADKITPEQIEIANTDRSRDILRKNLLSQLRSGAITKADAKQSLYVFDKVQQVSNSVKDLNVSSTEKAEVANLLSERNELNTLIQNKEPILAVKEKERINEIENKIVDIIQKSTFNETTKPKEDAIQEPSTDESLLRGEQPEVGLPKMEEGNAQPEGPTAGTTEVTNAQPQEKVKVNSELFFDDADVMFPNDDIRGGYAVTNEDGKQIGRIKMSKVDDNVVKIDEVVSEQRGERTGNGSAIMKMVIDNADKNNVTLTLTPNLIGDLKAKGFETPKQLQNFYEKFGFVKDSGRATMTRNPISQPTTEVSSKTQPTEAATDEQKIIEDIYNEAFGITPEEAPIPPVQMPPIEQVIPTEEVAPTEETLTPQEKKKRASAASTNDKLIKNSLKSLKSVFPNLPVKIFDTLKEYRQYLADNGYNPRDADDSRAMALFNNDGTQFAIVGLKGRMRNTTLPHEVWHVLLSKAFAFNQNKTLFRKFRKAIEKTLIESGNEQIVKDLSAFADQRYYKRRGQSSEEFLVQLGAYLTVSGFKINELSQQEKTILSEIKDIINRFAQKIFNTKIFLADATPNDVLSFLVEMSDSMRRGEDLNQYFEQGKAPIAEKKGNYLREKNTSKESKISNENRDKAIKVARTMGMNDKGFFGKNSNPSQLNNMLRQYGYGVKQARVTADGFGGGYFLVDEQGRKAIKAPTSKSEIDAYHGSSKKFNKFSTSKIGEGVGAQTQGWGLYFTDLKSVAKFYANNNNIYEVSLHKGKKPNEYTWLDWDKRIEKNIRDRILEKFIQEKNISKDVLNKITKATEEDIDGADLYDLFKELGITTQEGFAINALLRDKYSSSGLVIYDNLKKAFGNIDSNASEFLLRANIDGVKYKHTYDGGSGFNYVVFDENAVTIKKVSKAQVSDLSNAIKFVEKARAQGLSEEKIKTFLESKDFSDYEIQEAMSPDVEASSRIKLTEDLLPGIESLMNRVDGLIETAKNDGLSKQDQLANVLKRIEKIPTYKNATDVQRERIIKDIEKKIGITQKRAPSVDTILGNIQDVKKITMTEKQLLIEQLKNKIKGAKDAISAYKQAAVLIAQEIKGLVKSGTITARQGGFIVSKFAKVNMLSPTSVSRFVDYMGKVFADAEYGAQLKTASGLRADIKKLSKNKDKNADFRKLAQEFINIDPSMVDDIYAYNEMASQIKSSVKGSTLRGANVKFSDVVSIQDATRYISDTLRVQDKKILEEQRAEVQELMDIDASEMTPEQLRILLEGEGEVKVTKYNESIVRSLLDKAFKAYSGVINEILKTGYDAFYTGEKVELTKNQKTLIKQFMDMDLTVLTPKESLQAVDALANFIQNQSTAKMETIVSDYTGRLNARKLAESKVKAQPLMKYKSKGFGKFLAEQTTTLPILFEKMFKGFNRSGKVMDMMGVTKLINGKSLAQNQSNMIVNDYVRQFFNKKANGEAFNTESNNVERGMASFMMRNVIGTEQEMKDEFNRRKNLLEESIEVLSKGNDLEQQKAALYQKAYDKILKDSKTIQEVKSKTDATNLEAIEFWTNQWADKYEELSDVSENVYNKILDKDINYTPDRFARISSDTGEVDLANDESAFHNNNGTIYKKETGVLMKATKPETLPTNKKNGKPTSYIELSFDKNNSNAMYDALVDMKTASAIRQIEAFENSEDFDKIVPTADDAKILKDRVQLYVRNIRNKSPYSDDQFSKAVRRLNKLAAFGVGQALSGFAQPIKQMVPVLTNTLINAGSIDIMSGFNAAKQKFMSESGYGIANRGVESQAQIESLNKLIDSAPTGNFDKAIKKIEKINQDYLQIFLVNPDVFIARASWMSYYEKSLKKQGIDPNGIDYNTHELNEEAANYAQRMVDRQQNISDVDLSGKLFASKESANQVLVKMLMPFASFRMNQSARLGADLATLADKTATEEDKKIATKSLAGFGVELATFKMISAGIAIALGTLTKALMGQDEDEEEKDKRMNNVIKGQWTGTITDIISPLPVVDKPIQYMVEPISKLLEEGTGLPLSTFGVSKSDWTSNLGTFGISAQRASELYDMSKLAATGKYTDDFNKEHTISDESQEQITWLIPAAMLSNMGVVPSEVNTVVKNAVKYAKKNTKSPEEKQQAQENKEERESNKQEKINALETIIEESNDEAIINQAKDKIDELDADKEEKKIIKQENAEEKKEKKKLLVDPNTGEEYDTETDLKRYNRDLWEQNFGEGSDWYESHKEEKEMESLLRKKVQQMKDEEMNYTGRNSDGSKKRFGASATKKTQRFGSSSKGKVKRFGS